LKIKLTYFHLSLLFPPLNPGQIGKETEKLLALSLSALRLPLAASLACPAPAAKPTSYAQIAHHRSY